MAGFTSDFTLVSLCRELWLNGSANMTARHVYCRRSSAGNIAHASLRSLFGALKILLHWFSHFPTVNASFEFDQGPSSDEVNCLRRHVYTSTDKPQIRNVSINSSVFLRLLHEIDRSLYLEVIVLEMEILHIVCVDVGCDNVL